MLIGITTRQTAPTCRQKIPSTRLAIAAQLRGEQQTIKAVYPRAFSGDFAWEWLWVLGVENLLGGTRYQRGICVQLMV
jgi:hypothetical protein